MSNKDFIPGSDNDFYVWADTFFNYANPFMTQWEVPEASWQALNDLHNDFRIKFEVAKDIQTRTHITILSKTEARGRLELSIRSFLKSYITYNPHVTNEDRTGMGLPIHDTKPTPMDDPHSYPKVTVKSSSPAVVELHIIDSETNGKAKPEGVHGAEIRWLIALEPPINWTELTNSSFTTHSPCILSFAREQRGNRLFFALRWENTRGIKGPWSDIESTIIP
jgi:hypothetical protein